MKSVLDFRKFKIEGKKISVITCYDYTSAQIINQSDIDAVLVGDSASMVVHGYENTVYADLSMMCSHIQAVKRGLKEKLIIADLPFLEHKKGISHTISAVDKIIKAGASAVKIESAAGNLELIKTLSEAGVPVMGHLGLTPQFIYSIGGYKVQGRDNNEAEMLINDSLSLESAGCFSIVLELIPEKLAGDITKKLSIPTIGIGAGAFTDGQVLVFQDLLGMNKDFNPKFVRKYMNGFELILQSLNDYNRDIKNSSFPNVNESFH